MSPTVMLLTVIAAMVSVGSGTRFVDWRQGSRDILTDQTTYFLSRSKISSLIQCIVSCTLDTTCAVALHDYSDGICHLMTISSQGVTLPRMLSIHRRFYTRRHTAKDDTTERLSQTRTNPPLKAVKRRTDRMETSLKPFTGENMTVNTTLDTIANRSTLVGNDSVVSKRMAAFKSRDGSSVPENVTTKGETTREIPMATIKPNRSALNPGNKSGIGSLVLKESVISYKPNGGMFNTDNITTKEETTREVPTLSTKPIRPRVGNQSRCICTFPVCPNNRSQGRQQQILTQHDIRERSFLKTYDFEKEYFTTLFEIPESWSALMDLAVDSIRSIIYVMSIDNAVISACSDGSQKTFITDADQFVLDRQRNIFIYTKQQAGRDVIKSKSFDAQKDRVLKKVRWNFVISALELDSSAAMLYWSNGNVVIGCKYWDASCKASRIATFTHGPEFTFSSILKMFLFCGQSTNALYGQGLTRKGRERLSKCKGKNLCIFGGDIRNDVFMLCGYNNRAFITFVSKSSSPRKRIRIPSLNIFVG